MTEVEKFCEENNVKFRLSDIGKNIGVVALEYINMLEKENESIKCINKEIQEDDEFYQKENKRLEKENAELKESVEYWKNEYYYLRANPEEA